jgi:hypothetical protein
MNSSRHKMVAAIAQDTHTDAGRKKARAIADVKLIEYPGAPHGLFATHKAQLTQDLVNFIES